MNKFTPSLISTILFNLKLKEKDEPLSTDTELFHDYLVMSVPCNRQTAVSAVRFPGVLPARALDSLIELSKPVNMDEQEVYTDEVPEGVSEPEATNEPKLEQLVPQKEVSSTDSESDIKAPIDVPTKKKGK